MIRIIVSLSKWIALSVFLGWLALQAVEAGNKVQDIKAKQIVAEQKMWAEINE